jgi:hypothetical protein
MKECNEVITLFNAKFESTADSDTYQRTVISGASWFGTVKSSVDKTGLNAANQFTIRIPVDADTEGKAYIDVQGYTEAEDVSALFTLNEGDIIVRGVADAGLRPAEIRKQYAEVITILAITDSSKRSNAPHWKVVGA